MTELLSGIEAPSDAELISRVRGGDVAAYGELFSRHVEAARRLGRQLVRGPDVDDLVSDAFARTLQVLKGGGGPDVAFRAYLLTSVRRLHVDRIRAAKRVQPSDDMTRYDPGVAFTDTAIAEFEHGAAAKAFQSLPERWQLVLWHLEVERQKPADIAPLLGMTPNSVSALAYRAREGLRQAFLTMHLAGCPTEDCHWTNEHLGAYVRSGLSRRDTTKVEEHLDGCRRCTAMYLELTEINSNLAGIIGPLLLGAAAAGYVSAAGSAALTGIAAFFGRVRDTVVANTGGGTVVSGGGGLVTGGAVTSGGMLTVGGIAAAGVAAVTTAAFVLGAGAPTRATPGPEQPVGAVARTPASPEPLATAVRQRPSAAAAENSRSSADKESTDPIPTEASGLAIADPAPASATGDSMSGLGAGDPGRGSDAGVRDQAGPPPAEQPPSQLVDGSGSEVGVPDTAPEPAPVPPGKGASGDGNHDPSNGQAGQTDGQAGDQTGGQTGSTEGQTGGTGNGGAGSPADDGNNGGGNNDTVDDGNNGGGNDDAGNKSGGNQGNPGKAAGASKPPNGDKFAGKGSPG